MSQSPTQKLKKEKKVKIKAWVVLYKRTNDPQKAFFSRKEALREIIDYSLKNCILNNISAKELEKDLKVIPCEITYSLPITKSKNVIK